CGLEIVTRGDQIVSIMGDKNDPLSQGFICPKATALQDILHDPDRLRQPVERDGDQWQEISWDDAYSKVAQRMHAIQQQHGNNAVGIFAGNPNVHNYGSMTHNNQFLRALKTKNRFSATSVDQLPHHMVSYWMYGHQFLLPIPDIDHTQYMLMLGANPLASNGSMMTVPNVKKRLQALQARGGKLIVIDPRRSETAALADTHHFIRPGSDAYLLLAIIHVLFEENWIKVDDWQARLQDFAKLEQAVRDFSPKLAAQHTGIAAATIQDIAKDLASAESAVCYGRMGVSTQQHGTVCQWAIQIINLLTGNLDRAGGALVPQPAFGYVKPGESGAGNFARWHSRVRGLPEFGGELPCSAMAEEILTAGEGQIRAMITVAGNPILSTPNARQLDKAFKQLDFMLAIDFYINETTRHADIILPPTSALEHDHYDIAFLRLAVRDTARFNEAVVAKTDNTRHDWEIFNGLGKAFAELGDAPYKDLPPPRDLIDMAIQHGHYGSASQHELELSVAKLCSDYPHGVDLGPLKPSLKARLCTPGSLVQCAPTQIMEQLPSLASAKIDHDLRLIGRRHVRSNNSWMHNYHRLVKGKPRDQLLMNPEDIAACQLSDGAQASLKSRVGQERVTVLACNDMMPGCVSLPHGWGHNRPGIQLSVASEHSGVNVNDLTDDQELDPISGNAALNGIKVEVRAL
ncbi:MAG: molybdopterin-dependent oxidoreductase, partial [Pseudomonadales bacterium]